MRVAPSMKMLIPSGPCAPLESDLDVPLSLSIVTWVPGARAARSRKFRLGVGSPSTCCCVMLVATSDVRVSTPAAATTVTAATSIADAASRKSRGYTSAISTRTRIFWGAMPTWRAVTSYSAGTRPSMA